jgi:alkylation response protein AidB-like acyl-CoA dehydrogenase
MDFGLTAEQEQLAQAERSWLLRHDPVARLRATLDTAPITVDPAALMHATESGLVSVLTPDMGGSHADLSVLTEAHGHGASSLPLADLAVAIWVLSRANRPEAEAAAEGAQVVGVARGPEATLVGNRLELHGVSSPVPMARDMTCFVVVGTLPDGDYAAVLRDVDLVEMTTLDVSRTWARLNLEMVVEDWDPLPAGTSGHLREALALHRSVDALGAASRLLGMTVAYAAQREQFGSPIGSFQAVKHHCADMAVAVEAGRSVLSRAARSMDGEDGLGGRAVAAAAAYAKAAASRVASTALQVHGGIGFTWEHDLHVFLRRIKVNEAFDGTVAEHRAALVRH